MEPRNSFFLIVLVCVAYVNSNPTVTPQPTVQSTPEPSSTIKVSLDTAKDRPVAPKGVPAVGSGSQINCNTPQDCIDAGMGADSSCTGTTCHCNVGFHQSPSTKKCLKSRELGQGCEENMQCDDIGNAECSSYICKCKAGFKAAGNKCWSEKKLGEACSADDECKVTTKDAHCKDSVCACRDGMVSHSDGKRCLIVAQKIGDSCEETTQCSSDLGKAVCEGGKCQCLDDSHVKNNGCVKTLYVGDRCDGVEGECFLPKSFGLTRIECSSNICQCKDPFVPSEDKKYCHGKDEKDPGSGGGAASVYPLMASIVTVIAALIFTS